MEEFLNFLDGRMETPGLFGWFHLLWLGIMIASCVLIYIFRKRISPKAANIILLVTGIVIILFEVYKQINFSFNYNTGGGTSTWDYQWYAFPFQFCSTPMYVMLLAGILRKGKVYNCLLSYLSSYALFAGLVVMLYPGDVYISTIGINIQTMVCHGGMFVIGFLLLATRSVKFNLETFLKASIVFVIMLITALLMNVIWHFAGNDETFNMFYISPYYACTLPLLSLIYTMVPYTVFLLCYIIGFALVALIMLLIAFGFAKLEQKIQKRKNPINDTSDQILEIIRSDLK